VSDWPRHRKAYYSAGGALDYIDCASDALARLPEHPTVIAALAQIDMAERAIASVAEQLEHEQYERDEE